MFAATMKRFFLTTILTVVIVGVLVHFMPRSFDTYVSKLSADATVTIFCRQTELAAVDTGMGFMVQCSADDFAATAAQCRSIDGVTVSFPASFEEVQKLCKFFGLKVTSTYEQDGLFVVSGASSMLSGGVMIAGELVNLQIAHKDGVVHLGSPLILGDY